jgi:hypothetical protein
MSSEVAEVTWLPAVLNEAVKSVEVTPWAGGVKVVLHLQGDGEVLGLDPVGEVLGPRVAQLWKAVPPVAAKACQAVLDAEEGLRAMEAELRRTQALAEGKTDSGLPADDELSRAVDLRHKVVIRKEAIKGLRSRAEAALAQARRDVRHLAALSRVEVMQEAAQAAEAAFARLAMAIAEPLAELVRARVVWSALVSGTASQADRLEGQFLPELPQAIPEPRVVNIPPELMGRHGFLHPATGHFVEADELPRPQPEPVHYADPATVARVAAQLNYQTVAGHEDAKGRFVQGPPPGPGEKVMPPLPAFENTVFPTAGEPVKNDKAKQEADEEARALAALWLQEAEEARRLAQEQALPQPDPLPVAPALPESPPLPAVVLPPAPLDLGGEEPPRKKRK